jgi:hypothetical protein
MQQSATIDKIGVADHRILASEFIDKWINSKIDKSIGEHNFKMDNQAFKLDHPFASDIESFMHYIVKYCISKLRYLPHIFLELKWEAMNG